MPLAGLRKQPSLKSLRLHETHESAVDPRRPKSTHAISSDQSFLRPGTANPRPRPVSSHGDRLPFHDRPTSAGLSTLSLNQTRRNRFSLMRFKSDSHLRSAYNQDLVNDMPSRQDAPSPFSDAAPGKSFLLAWSQIHLIIVLPAPTIGVTAPPPQAPVGTPKKQKNRLRPLFRSRASHAKSAASSSPERPHDYSKSRSFEQNMRRDGGLASSNTSSQDVDAASNFSRGNSSESRLRDTAAEQRRPTSSASLFKFSRRPKQKKNGGLFPLPPELDPAQKSQLAPATTRSAQPPSTFQSPGVHYAQDADGSSDQLPHSGQSMSASTRPSPMIRNMSSTSGKSLHSSSYTNLAGLARRRSRTNTMKSFPGHHDLDRVPTPGMDSGRNSTASTTLGRNSMAGLRSFTNRFRGPGDSNSPRSGGNGTPIASNSNSFALSRETLVVPEREDGETAGKYYSRLERDYPKKGIAMIFSKSTDGFAHDVLRSLMRTFMFYEEPVDMSLRRFLWEIDLPSESQQIDRVISAFAERYHECNPHIFDSFDAAYLVAYSLLMLHSDLFNKNNKRKMQRHEYQKNTKGNGISEEILGYFYDNIGYTEFIAHNIDDDDSEKHTKTNARVMAKKIGGRPGEHHERARPASRDPYDAIIDDKRRLEILRPALKEVLNLEDPYNYLGTAPRLNLHRLRTTFSNFGVLQIVSARSRPDAFADPMTTTNPHEAHAGVVDIKVVKVGTLWRKDAKKKKARSPWQEWGAILTSSQLYFCRNSSWVKGLVSQHEHHQKHGGRGRPVVFKPPLEQFVHEAQVATTNSVALQDASYKRHKHAFVLARRGEHWTEKASGKHFEEVLLADNETEMNDWIAKLNYAATFMTANVNVPASGHDEAPSESNAEESQADTDVESPTAPISSRTLAIRKVIPDDDNESRQQQADGNEDPRLYVLKRRVHDMDESLNIAKAKLTEQLKTARHLEILAPFPAKTRGELLSFGARMSHNIRWSRYDFWRAKCQRDILSRELEIATEGNASIIAVSDQALSVSKSPASSPPSGISRLSSKASMIPPRQTSATRLADQERHNKRLSQASFSGSNRTSLLAAGIDQAFATPFEAAGRGEGQDENGPFKLPPLGLGTSASSSGLRERYKAIQAEHKRRHSSISTAVSSTGLSEAADAGEVAEAPESGEDFTTPRQSVHGGVDKHLDVDSEKESTGISSSPRSRPSVRRSLQRTLRDRDNSSPSRQRRMSRRHKDSHSSAGGPDDASSGKDEGLSRRAGSFKLHGKKASVITLGTEWQQVSPEELLRQRRAHQIDTKMKDPTSGSPDLGSLSQFAATRHADAEASSTDAPIDGSPSVYETGDEHVDSPAE